MRKQTITALFTMAKQGMVGWAIATEYVKDAKDIPDYEFPDRCDRFHLLLFF